MLKRLVTKKRKGLSDMIASLIVLVAMTIFIFTFINVIGDVNTRIQMDQVARKYILRMESAGELTSSDITSMKDELMKISSVKKATELGGTIEISDKGTSKKGYASTVEVYIKCPAVTTGYDSSKGMMGAITRNKITYYEVTKQSTAKY